MATGTRKKASPDSKGFAVIETGGKQYLVYPGETLRVEKLPPSDSDVIFSKVLLWNDGKEVRVGEPYLDGVHVTAERLEDGRKKKVRIIRFHSKTRHRRKKGHRQYYTAIRVGLVAKKNAAKTAA